MRKVPRHNDYSGAIGRLIEALHKRGIEVRQDAGDCLARLAQLIVDWNRSINLISRQDVDRLVTYHFCDSASLLPIITPKCELEAVDIGGSNGLPGLVLAGLCSRLRVTVCDGRRKRENFLRAACDAVGGATYLIERADEESFQKAKHEAFDLVVARAVTKLRILLKWALPLVRPGGVIVAYKGSGALGEVKPAEKYLERGGRALLVIASPWGNWCNPLRNFVIVRRAG